MAKKSNYSIKRTLARCCLGLALMTAGTVCANAELKQALTLHTVEGSDIVYFLDDKPAVTFSGGDMIVTVTDKDSPENIPMDNVEKWTVGYVDHSSVSDLSAIGTKVVISVFPGRILVDNPDGQTVAVYSIDGKAVASAVGYHVEFSLQQGLYVVFASNKTSKIIIR